MKHASSAHTPAWSTEARALELRERYMTTSRPPCDSTGLLEVGTQDPRGSCKPTRGELGSRGRLGNGRAPRPSSESRREEGA